MKIAIITGASSGIGKEFVKQLDKQEVWDEIWVIARREDRLLALQKEISAPLRAIALDLTDPKSIDCLKELLQEQKPTVSALVNAGGFGRFGAFEAISLEEQYEMIDLNQKALLGITYAALPYCTEHSRIYQMASISAFQPIPYIAVYSATKAFVLSFSRALNRELLSRKIHVMAICPFWVKTEFFNRAVTDDTVKKYVRFLTAEQVVRRALRDMKKGKDVSVCDIRNRLQVLLVKLLPHSLVMKVWCRQQGK